MHPQDNPAGQATTRERPVSSQTVLNRYGRLRAAGVSSLSLEVSDFTVFDNCQCVEGASVARTRILWWP